MSVKEYAALKGVNRDTVVRWITSGYIAAERTGPRGHWRILGDAAASNTLPNSENSTTSAH